MKILLFEKHFGLAISNYLLLKDIGYDVDLILNYSDMSYSQMWNLNLNNNESKEYLEAKDRLKEISQYGIVDIIKNNIKINKPPIYDVVLTTFPPTNIIFLEACNLGKINHVNLSNKFDIHSSNAVTSQTDNSCPRFPNVEERMIIHEYFNNTSVKITASNRFDQEYYKYYTNKNIEYIPFVPYQIYDNFSKDYENNLIGIFPMHSFYLENNMKIINEIINLGEKKNFNFIYKKDYNTRLNIEDFSRTMCNIVIPYNYFSISQSESSFISPSIYPDDNFITNNRTIYTDSAMFPNYSNENDVKEFELKVNKFGDFTPQSYERKDQLHWLKFANYSDSKITKFKDIGDIFEIIKSLDFDKERERLYNDNNVQIENAKNIWKGMYE